jgi:hypothetical protein
MTLEFLMQRHDSRGSFTNLEVVHTYLGTGHIVLGTLQLFQHALVLSLPAMS